MSDSAFFSDGQRLIELSSQRRLSDRENSALSNTPKCALEEYYDLERSVSWVTEQSSKSRIALQFPDVLLADSTAVSQILKKSLPESEFFVLADTSFGSCCVDFVAAQHYHADLLIHYGSSCLSQVTDSNLTGASIPVLWVFGRAQINASDCVNKLSQLVLSSNTAKEATPTNHRHYVLMYSVEYEYLKDVLSADLKSNLPNSSITTSYCITSNKPQSPESDSKVLEVNGRWWIPSAEGQSLADYDVMYIGAENRTLSNLMLTMSESRFYLYNPITERASEIDRTPANRCLMKRYYLVERARDARIVGLLFGTMSVKSCVAMHDRLQNLVKKAGKKCYSFVVGKVNTAKLANFMEIDIFVLVSCTENSLMDSSEFYKPIITPYELELACNAERTWSSSYITDFSSLLPGGALYTPLPDQIEAYTDVSLITGGMRQFGVTSSDDQVSERAIGKVGTRELVVAGDVPANNAADYLASRTWQGLEVNLGENPVVPIKQGDKGVAMSYQSEPKLCEDKG